MPAVKLCTHEAAAARTDTVFVCVHCADKLSELVNAASDLDQYLTWEKTTPGDKARLRMHRAIAALTEGK
jgi:hypothetical protein